MAEPWLHRLMDLFAGCGGMTRGFVDSGSYEPVLAVEMDADAGAAYAANFGAEHVVTDKIENVEITRQRRSHISRCPIVVGSPR